MSKEIVLIPRLSEKSFAQSQLTRTYAFVVPKGTNKHEVARAVEAQFEVTVTTVNITNVKGKAKRSVSAKGRRVANGSQSDFKKAYVTLAEGFSLAVFGAEEETKEDKKAREAAEKEAAKKAEKKAPKKAAKTEKKADKKEETK